MIKPQIINLTIKQALEGLKKGDFLARDLVESALLKATEAQDYHLLLSTFEDAFEKADEADTRIKSGKARKLEGIPITIKDNILVKGQTATAGAKLLTNFVAPYSATIVEKLEEQGAIIIGKNNLDAWAHGSSTENSDFGPSLNPWSKNHVPGGSSGGSAGAVALGIGLASVGTDTGGSIRQPAAFCGVTGFKPTYGRLSRYGLVAMASSLDCPGPLTRSAEDSAILANILSGQDVNDATTVPTEKIAVPTFEQQNSLAGMKIGLPREYFGEGIAPEILTGLQETQRVLESLGAEFVEVSLPMTKYALSVYYIIQPAEVSSNLSRYDGIRYGERVAGKSLLETYKLSRTAGLGHEAKRRIMMGTYVLSSGYYDAYYKKAMQARTKIIEDFHQAFDQVDFLLTPTTPHPAFEFGAKKDPLSMYLEDIFTVSANIAGLPAISFPCGFSEKNGVKLPIGAQIMGPQLSDSDVLKIAMAYQRETDWHLQMPAVA